MNKLLVYVFILFTSLLINAQELKIPKSFIKYDQDFQSALLTFRHPKTGKEILFLGMSHVADVDFFVETVRIAQQCDVVLEEGVSGNYGLSTLPFYYIFLIQKRLTYLLNVQHQGTVLDTRRAPWKNADVKISDICPSWWRVTLSYLVLPIQIILFESAIVINETARMGYSLIGCRHFYGKQSRYYFYSSMQDVEEKEITLGSWDYYILTKRNQKVLETLNECLQKEQNKRIFIPWGAAHLPGLIPEVEKKGYELKEIRWIPLVYIENESRQQNPVNTFYFPFVYSHSLSSYYREVEGPLSLIQWRNYCYLKRTSFNIGYRLVYNYLFFEDVVQNSLLNGGIYKYEKDSLNSNFMIGWGLYKKTKNQVVNYETSYLYSNYVYEQERKNKKLVTTRRIGWWGWLFNSETQQEEYSQKIISKKIRFFPSIGKYPLIYSYEKENEIGKHRFFLFFKI